MNPVLSTDNLEHYLTINKSWSVEYPENLLVAHLGGVGEGIGDGPVAIQRDHAQVQDRGRWGCGEQLR